MRKRRYKLQVDGRVVYVWAYSMTQAHFFVDFRKLDLTKYKANGTI